MHNEIRKTSFGFMAETEKNGKMVELLEFHRSGRPHKHKETEEFSVIEGEGLLIVEDQELLITKGDKISIGSDKVHYMKPSDGVVLKLRVTYL